MLTLKELVVFTSLLAAQVVMSKSSSVVGEDLRAVTNWFEQNRGTGYDGEVWSQEWINRFTHWHEQYDDDFRTGKENVMKYQQAPEDLDIGVLGLESPVTSFVLWSLVERFEELDCMVFGTECSDSTVLAPVKPLGYLKQQQKKRLSGQWDRSLDEGDVGQPDKSYSYMKDRLSSIEGYREEVEMAWLVWDKVCHDDSTRSPSTSWVFECAKSEKLRRFKELDKFMESLNDQVLRLMGQKVIPDAGLEQGSEQHKVVVYQIVASTEPYLGKGAGEDVELRRPDPTEATKRDDDANFAEHEFPEKITHRQLSRIASLRRCVQLLASRKKK